MFPVSGDAPVPELVVAVEHRAEATILAGHCMYFAHLLEEFGE